MADLIGFDGFPNATAPFEPHEYTVSWKSNTTYLDFSFKNEYKQECEYPRFWNESGQRVLAAVDKNFSKLAGCFDSEFDQVSGRDILLAQCSRLTVCSMAILKLSEISQTGNDSFRNSHRSRIACESGYRQSARRSSISCASSSASSISTDFVSTKRHK